MFLIAPLPQMWTKLWKWCCRIYQKINSCVSFNTWIKVRQVCFMYVDDIKTQWQLCFQVIQIELKAMVTVRSEKFSSWGCIQVELCVLAWLKPVAWYITCDPICCVRINLPTFYCNTTTTFCSSRNCCSASFLNGKLDRKRLFSWMHSLNSFTRFLITELNRVMINKKHSHEK